MFRHGWKLLILILIAVFIFLWLIKAPIMSSYLTKKLGLPTTVRMISMWPSKTTIHYFSIDNPRGYKPKKAFKVEKIQIDYRWGALTSDPRVIDLITLDEVTLNIDIKNPTASDNNWAAIGAQMPKSREKSREVLIRHLILNDVTVNVSGAGAKILGVSGTKHFKKMEFSNINSKQGFPTKELVRQIFEGAGLLKYLQEFLDPTQRIKKALNPFNIFGERKSAPESPRADYKN